MNRPHPHPYPEFYIIGAAKAGTTSLWNYLRDHPELFLGPVKEPNYFAYDDRGLNLTGPASADELRRRLHPDTITDDAAYRNLYAGASPGQVRGEASVRYLYKPMAAERLARARPDARLVVMLRDPVDRLVSHYAMNRSWNLEPLSLVDALAAEDERVAQGWGWDWHYVRVGCYAAQLERYHTHFDREQILTVAYETFRRDPESVVRAVCQHVGVDPSYRPDVSMRAKEAYLPRHRALEMLRRPDGPVRKVADRLVPSATARKAGAWLRRINHQPVEALTPEDRARLAERFAVEAEALQAVAGRAEPWRADQ